MTLESNGTKNRAKSPSRITRWNSIRVKEIIENSERACKFRNPWVQGVVVFTQNSFNLEVNNLDNPIIVKLEELPSRLLNFSKGRYLSPEELNIYTEILVESNVSKYYSVREQLVEIFSKLWDPQL